MEGEALMCIRPRVTNLLCCLQEMTFLTVTLHAYPMALMPDSLLENQLSVFSLSTLSRPRQAEQGGSCLLVLTKLVARSPGARTGEV